MTVALAVALVLVGGEVHPGDGPPLAGATVVIEDGRITAVGVGLAPPPGAERLDVTGKVITPGLIDPFCGLGLSEIHGVPESVDVDAAGPDPVRAAFRATDAFNPFSEVIAVQVAHGITGVGVAPRGGLVSGQLGVFRLRPELAPARPFAGLVVHVGGLAEGSRGVALGRLRALLDDARQHRERPERYAAHHFGQPRLGRRDLEALGRVVAGEVPLLAVAHRRADLRALLALAAEEKVGLVLVGASEAWADAEAIAQAKVPVILDPFENLPYDLDRRLARSDNAAILAGAGVAVALSTFDTHHVRKLRQGAGNAVRAGLAPGAALAAITAVPARILGLPEAGRVAPGAPADLVVWSGDPFELSTRAEVVLIDGQRPPRAHRQEALLNRYRRLDPTR